MTSRVMAQRRGLRKDRRILERTPAVNSPDPITSRSICTRDEASQPIRAPFALWVEDATYIDPIVDAWGQNVIRGLIEALQAGYCGLSAACANLIQYGRGLQRRRDPSPTYGGTSKI
jgi:hypothetical protein